MNPNIVYVDQPERKAVICIQLGTPESPTPYSVANFLNPFLGDKRVIPISAWWWKLLLHRIIIPLRSKRVAKLYASVWMKKGSPLRVYSEQLIQKLQTHYGDHIDVCLAMTYGNPDVEKVWESLEKKNARQCLIIPMFPQYAESTSAAALDALIKAWQNAHTLPSFYFLRDYAEHPLYIQALADSISLHWGKHGRAEKLLMSFHGIPLSQTQTGDDYAVRCKKTAMALAKALDLSGGMWALSFQSRVGVKPWLSPYTDVLLADWARSGVHSVQVISPGFSVDGLETLEELAIRNREHFLHEGGKRYEYIAALNDSDAHVRLYQSLIDAWLLRA